MTPADDSGIEPLEVWNDVLGDRREVSMEDSGLVVTHRIRATSPSTVQFQILDPLPAEFDIEDVGFHSDLEPGAGRIGTDRAVIAGVAEPQGELVVKYGIQVGGQPRVADVESLQRTAKPSIEMSTDVEGTDPDDTDLEAAALTRSSSESAASNPGPDDSFADLEGRFEGKESAPWGSDVSGRGAPTGDSEEDDSQMEFDYAKSPPDDSSYLEDLFDEDVDTRSEESREPSIQYSGHRGDPFGDSESEASIASSITSREDEDTAAGVDEGVAELASPADDTNFVEALTSHLQPDRLLDEQRRRLGEQLRAELLDAEQGRRSTTVRLAHLESQLQRFETYADAMESILDEHGPAEKFLSEVRDDIASVEAMIDQLHRDMETATDDRSTQREWLNTLDKEVATLDSGQERLVNRLESLRSDYRRKTAEFDERLSKTEPMVQLIEDLETEVASLRETTASLDARLEAVVEALTSVEPE